MIDYKRVVYKIIGVFKKPDYYFVSYPKSGRTWVRFFLSRYISLFCGVNFDMEFSKKHKDCPEYYKIIFTHLNFISHKKKRNNCFRSLKNKDVIFLVRDPRDVVVSLYFQFHKREKENNRGFSPETDLSKFIRSEIYGISNIVKYIEDVLDNKSSFKSFYIIRYEDLHSDPEKEFKEFLKYLYKNVSNKYFKKALVESEFKKMQNIEKNNSINNFRLTPGNVDDVDSFKVRRGVVGGFNDYLNEDDIYYCNSIMKKNAYISEYYL